MKPASNSRRRAQPHLGTLVEIAADGAAGIDADGAIDAAFAAIATVHRLMSFHDSASDIGRLNRARPGEIVAIHDWTGQVLRCALEIAQRSDGAFDIDGSALALLPGNRVRVARAGLRIDLGGIAKGFAVDRALDALMANGAAGGIVNAGGDVGVRGSGTHRVHVRDPRDPRRLVCAVALANQAIASSGGVIEGRSGIVIDPHAGAPVSAILGATVRAPSCLIADALTKVVMVAGREAAPLLAQYRASALFAADGELFVTADWQAELDRAA